MKAPDKIYIGLEDVGSGYTWNLSILDTGIEQYIHKDALLEIVKEESKFWDDGEMIFRGLIDKIKSM